MAPHASPTWRNLTLIVSSPDMAREIMKTHDISFANDLLRRSRRSFSTTTWAWVSRHTVSIGGRVVSGKLFRGGRRNELFHELLEENSSRARRNFKRWDDLLDEVIEDHENGKDDGEEDFVDVLLSLQKDSNLDFKLEKDHMKAISMGMFGAGTETTYTT
uniref:Uncharacterized protein n=1 Tax=Ananas comosus var. bracteatus TaxID=296719 RepID=A0A6V7NHW1_ANACO|nr:unnamed protein product [Ananas comosus var. bracteatus]